ncbi:flippase [Methanococcoides orientis]|uniref:flippase n=1 Tax=Methanococcoides orientis TaxID=2822137 RepID=UPI001E589925|nr:flippase [Methanococcoides orientis]UGV40623.1 flippase [Methanococcoides orientis]
MSKTKFIKDVGLIGITQVITSLGAFLLLPIITKSLGTYYYGMWAQIHVTIGLLTPLAMMGLSMGFMRFFSSVTDKEIIKEGLYSILIFIVCSSLLFSSILFFSADLLASIFFQDQNASYFLRIASFLIFFNATNMITLFYFRVFRQINIFSYFSIFKSLGTLILAMLFLWAGFGLFGLILAFLIIQFILFIVSMYGIISQIGFIFPKFIYIREYLRFSLPLTPNSLIRWITDSSDKYMVTYFLGLGSVGIYSAAYSIGWLIHLFISPIQVILYPELSKLYDEGKEDQVKLYLSYSMKYFLMIAIPAVFGLTALGKPLLEILTNSDFVSGSIVIPFIALSGVLAGVFQILINITHLVKDTKFNLYIYLIAATFNIILNLILIPKIGILGAAISTMISFIVMVIICIYVTFKHIKFSLNFIFIAKCILSSLIMYVFVSSYESTNYLLILSETIIGVIIYFFVMYSIKSFNQYELNQAKKILINVKKMLK